MTERTNAERRSRIGLGILLIVLGVAFLVGRQLQIDWGAVGWPMFIVASGIGLFVLAFVVGGKPGTGFAVPAGIVTMTGLVLAAQNATGLWATWAYAWALVAPFGVGIGLVVYGALTGQRDVLRSGSGPLLVGLGLFAGFALFFEGFVGLSGFAIAGADTLIAAGVVALGIVIMLLGLRRRPAA